MSTTATPDRFTTLPDDHVLQATVVALEEHGFSVEVAGDLDAAPQAVLARLPQGSSVMTNTSVTLAETGIADAINAEDGRWDSARNKMFALDFATQAQQMKAIGGQPDYAVGSVHAVTRRNSSWSESEAFLDDDRRDPACSHHLVDDEDVVHPARHPIRSPGSRILERIAVLVDAPHPGCDIADDLLGSDDEDHVTGA